VLGRCRAARVTGLLDLAVRDGALPATSPQIEQAATAQREAMVTVLLLERLLLDTVALLRTACVTARVLKGSSAAHLDYPSPELRAFGDVDLLVRSERFDAAVAVLEGAGHQRRFPQPRPGFDRRFGKGASFVTHDGHELDLHRSFAMGPYGITLKLGDLWAREATYRVGGVPLAALGREERFLHACFHAALGDNPPRLVALRDIAQMLLDGRLDLRLVRLLAASWQADAVLARALGLTCTTFAIDVDASPLTAWAAGYRPGRSAQRALSVYIDPDGGYAARSFAALAAVSGLRAKASYLRALAFPTRGYVDQRHAGHMDRWRHGASAVLRRPRRA
jgi:hypothetical protein